MTIYFFNNLLHSWITGYGYLTLCPRCQQVKNNLIKIVNKVRVL